jgi:hypothetical protein
VETAGEAPARAQGRWLLFWKVLDLCFCC